MIKLEVGDMVKIDKSKYPPSIDFEPHAIITYINEQDRFIRVIWLDINWSEDNEDIYNSEYFQRVS